MNTHEQLVFATGFAFMIALCAAVFLGWLVWALMWDAYDHLTQHRTRRRNRQFDARVGRDCYRDVRGVTK
jgi:hypothetical protein